MHDPTLKGLPMSSIRINGETVHLKEVSRNDFQSLTAALFRLMKADEPLQGTLVRILGDAMAKGHALDSQIPQTVMWMMSDLGVKAATVQVTESKASIDEWQETEASRGDARWFGVANLESGRAFSAAIVNVHGRGIVLNGQRIRAYPQAREEVQKMVELIGKNRLINEDMLFTACRTLGLLMKDGKTAEDVDFKCCLELVSGLGVGDLVIDLNQGKLAVRAFNEAAAMSSALLAGADTKAVQAVRERLRGLQAQLEEMRRKMAAGEPLPPGVQPLQQQVVIPSVIGDRRGHRRSS